MCKYCGNKTEDGKDFCSDWCKEQYQKFCLV
ncbi:DUF2116 family Zn-ribbon domain-containing protein [Pedobacter sp.]